MSYLKYVIALFFALAVLETTYSYFNLSSVAHLGVAGSLYAYGMITLVLLRPSYAKRLLRLLGQKLGKQVAVSPTARLSLVLHAGYLLLFRVAFLIFTLAYLAQALYFSDPTIVSNPTPPTFASFLLMVFEHTFQPAAALLQYGNPDLMAATLRVDKEVVVAYRIMLYVSYSLIIIAVLKDAWLLGRDYALLQDVVSLNRLMGATPQRPEDMVERPFAQLNLSPILEYQLRDVETFARQLEISTSDLERHAFFKNLNRFTGKEARSSIEMAEEAISDAIRNNGNIDWPDRAANFWESLGGLRNLDRELSSVSGVSRYPVTYNLSQDQAARFVVLCFGLAELLRIEMKDPHDPAWWGFFLDGRPFPRY